MNKCTLILFFAAVFSFWPLQDKLKPGSLWLCICWPPIVMAAERNPTQFQQWAAFWLTSSAYVNNINWQLFALYIYYGLGEQAVEHLFPGLKLLLCFSLRDALKGKNWCLAPTFLSSHGQSSPNKTSNKLLCSCFSLGDSPNCFVFCISSLIIVYRLLF